MTLSPRQARFVQEYLIDLKGGLAAVRAGYARKCAAATASHLLGRPHVRAAIQAGMEERRRSTKITAERVLEEIAIIAFADLKDYVDEDTGGLKAIKDLPKDASRALASIGECPAKGGGVQISFRLNDKMRALDMLSRHLGICKEQGEFKHVVTAIFQMPRPGKVNG